MALETWIIDSSALHKLGLSRDLELWESRIERGLVHVASVTLLEIGYSVRSSADYHEVFSSGIVGNLVEVSLSVEAEKTATDIQRQMVARGHHRGVSLADLLVAAIAATKGHTVLHHDKDVDLISQVTKHPSERLRLEGE